jgi:hypothetical protein
MKVALAGFLQKGGSAGLGPASTPLLAVPRRARNSLVLEVGGGTHVLMRHQVEGFAKAARLGMLVDLDRHEVVLGEHVISLRGRDVPLGIFSVLAGRQGRPTRLQELFEPVWGRKYKPEFDSGTIYYPMCQVRKLLESSATGLREILVKVSGGYRLPPGMRVGTVRRARDPRVEDRSQESLIEMACQRGFIDNRSYCKVARVSKSTAPRDLLDMVRKGLLERVGEGRGTRYRPVTSRSPRSIDPSVEPWIRPARTPGHPDRKKQKSNSTRDDEVVLSISPLQDRIGPSRGEPHAWVGKR